MRSGWKIAAAGLLLTALAGCYHRHPKTATPQAAQAPSVPPAQMAQLTPSMPEVPPPADTPPIKLDTAVPEEAAKPVAHPRHSRRHAKVSEETAQETKPPETTPQANPPQNPEVASGGQPSENSPIGQLSTGSGNANTADRQALTNQIAATENKLNRIHRTFTSEEQKTAALIRTFITKAREALQTDDLDGAKNYSTKARILVDELTND